MSIIISWVSGLVSMFLFFFPNTNQQTIDLITSQSTSFRNILATADWFFPVNNLLFILGTILTIEIIVQGAKLAGWILHNISLGFFKRM
jgi:hypothetical protein